MDFTTGENDKTRGIYLTACKYIIF